MIIVGQFIVLVLLVVLLVLDVNILVFDVVLTQVLRSGAVGEVNAWLPSATPKSPQLHF